MRRFVRETVIFRTYLKFKSVYVCVHKKEKLPKLESDLFH